MPPTDDRYTAYNANAHDQGGPGPIGYLALVLAWAIPGLGHLILGQRARGIIFALTIHLLFAAGLLIGGIRAINPADQPIWTYTQFLTGWPMLVANYLEKNYFEPRYVRQEPDRRTEIEREYDNLCRSAGIDPNDNSPQGLAARQQFTREFLAANPLFAYHPKVQDMGSVYCGIAGMLNLLVMFDVLLRITGSIREDPAALKKERRIAQSAPTAGGAP